MVAETEGGVTLQRIVIDVRSEEMVLRVLYRSQDGPGPNTKARHREVSELARSGLTQVLEALEGGAEVVGASGFTQSEDTLSVPRSSGVKEAAMLRHAPYHHIRGGKC